MADDDEVPVGIAVASAAVVTSDERFEKKKRCAHWLTVAAGGLLCVAAGRKAYSTNQACNGLLVRTVMLWMCVFGVLLVLAELNVQKVRNAVQILAYRSGRAVLCIMTSTICIAAAPSEVNLAYFSGTDGSASVVKSVDWPIGFVGVVLGLAAYHTLKVSALSKISKMNRGKGDADSTTSAASASSASKVLI